jgi:uncharacterized protein
MRRQPVRRAARRQWWCLLAVIQSLAALCVPASADFTTALAAYDRQDYETAFEEFRTLAQIGHPPSQHNLAVLYLRGLGTDASRDLAFGWLTLAAEAGYRKSTDALAADFASPAAAQLEAANRLKTQFGPQAIARRLLPDPKCQPFDTPPLPGKLKPPKVSASVMNKLKVPGLVLVEFYVAADGRSREPRILQALPRDVFDDAVMQSVITSSFTPARRQNQPVGQWTRLAYTFAQPGSGGFQPFVQSVKAQAEAGNPRTQYLYSLVLMSPGMVTAAPSEQEMEQARLWRLKAAQAGVPQAQFMLGRDQLSTACEGSIGRAMEWIRLAARSELPEAQVMLSQAIEAQVLFDPDPRKSALALLERAAHSNDLPSMRALAETLAASSLRDGERALAVSEQLVKRQPYYPTVFELRAASYAALERFDEAVGDQRKAIKLASKLKWNVAPLTQRLEAYVARKPWTGAILLPQDRSPSIQGT